MYFIMKLEIVNFLVGCLCQVSASFVRFTITLRFKIS